MTATFVKSNCNFRTGFMNVLTSAAPTLFPSRNKKTSAAFDASSEPEPHQMSPTSFGVFESNITRLFLNKSDKYTFAFYLQTRNIIKVERAKNSKSTFKV